jgi:hypothetical protein
MLRVWIPYLGILGAGGFAIAAGVMGVNPWKQRETMLEAKKATVWIRLLSILGGGMVAYGILRSPTPWERVRVYDLALGTPAAQIQRIVITAGGRGDRRLVGNLRVVVTDRRRIEKITAALHSSSAIWSWKRRRVRWSVRVEIVTDAGSCHLAVAATFRGDSAWAVVAPLAEKDGTFWRVADMRADGLEGVLEEAVGAAPGR